MNKSNGAPFRNANDIDITRALENRRLGIYHKNDTYSCGVQTHAEDIFVRKKFSELQCEMPGTPRSTFLMVFSPDGSKVASTHGNHNIYVTDVRTGKNIKILIGHPRTPWCIAFHPKSNQILASGCLGGQVRIWDLSGGSEVWTSEVPTVIASIAFHPDDRLLVIATYNELYFWDWSKPEPFMHAATANLKEKVRYVAFDKLGHKLITGISNSPQTRWERVRAPVPVPRQADRSVSPYRRRITPRLISNMVMASTSVQAPQNNDNSNRQPLSTVPERERRITACYRNLVREYELLVHRYLQIYRPPTMIDQGTDPMEIDLNAITGSNVGSLSAQPSTSGAQTNNQELENEGNEVTFRQFPYNNHTSLNSIRLSTPCTVNSSTRSSEYALPANNTYQMRPIDLSTCTSSQQVNANIETPSDSADVSNENETISLDVPSSAYPTTPLILSPSDIHSLRTSITKMRSTQTQNTYSSIDNIPTTSGLQHRNERRNSAPPSTSCNNPTNNLSDALSNVSDKGNANTPSTSIAVPSSSTNNLSNVCKSSNSMTVLTSNINASAQSNCTDNIHNNNNIKNSESSYKMRIKLSISNSNNKNENKFTNLMTTKYYEILKEIKNLASNINQVPNTVQEISSRATEKFLDSLKTKLNNSALNSEEPTPSTSGIHTKPPENYDSSSSHDDTKLQLSSKKEPSKSYEHSRKRLYPGFSKKNRKKPVLDSSTDSSSSEEDTHIMKRSCTPMAASLILPPPTANDRSNLSKVTVQRDLNDKHNKESIKSRNFNKELELLVTDLLVDNGNSSQGHFDATNQIRAENSESLPQPTTSQNDASSTSTINSSNCSKNSERTNARTTNNAFYMFTGNNRNNRPNRFFSQRPSAFYPTQIHNLRPYSSLRRYLPPTNRNRLRVTASTPNRSFRTSRQDEAVDHSERVAINENVQQPSTQFHPFDPPPEFITINPEYIGIGNMYSNIVRELESSLNDVRNIRAGNRLGETSDMLSTFSERLESIMNQSNDILRNLRTSVDTLQSNDQNINISNNMNNDTRVLFSDDSFYLRDNRNNQIHEINSTQDTNNLDSSNNLFSDRNSVTSDHTYPLNSRNSQPSTNNMSPLTVSLHLTVSHIQRQARLLRQQVESIERIDRAMLEVAQLQMIRQMLIEIQYYFSNAAGLENRSAVSSVRQMMAGTRISDSSPYNSSTEENTNGNTNNSVNIASNINNSTNVHGSTATQTRGQPRKAYPRCIFLMRNFRRGSSVNNIVQRRCLSRERIRRQLFRRTSFTCRSTVDIAANRNTVNQLTSETLRSLTRRLEHFLMEHGRHLGHAVDTNRQNTFGSDKDEYIMMLRLNQCRARILSQNAHGISNISRQISAVTADGFSRYSARDVLTSATETLSRYIMNGTNITPSLRSLICNVIDLSLLLTEILLLQVVDAIPPPSGMNLDSERENLSARIDQMCSRILQNRLSGHSQQLTRSLRLTRLAVRHASRALNQTYTARRNSLLPNNHQDQRRVLLEEINNCLRNIRRHEGITQTSNQRIEANSENLSRTDWYRTIHSLISRYTSSTILDAQTNVNESAANINIEERANVSNMNTTTTYTQASSDDDNESYWNSNNPINNNNRINNSARNLRNGRSRPLYRTNNINLYNILSNDESNSSTTVNRNRPWNVPVVQVNDVPISQHQSMWHPRFLANRQRLNERFSELRTYPVGGVFRPRFLHPFYTGSPFEADFDESVREQVYDSDIMASVTPNHRIQVWEFSSKIIPNINNALQNVVVSECKIHNDASVDIANNGNILVTLLPSGGYLNGTNRLGIYSLNWETLGQCLYVTNFEQNAVSVSLSPQSHHLVVGLASRRVSIMPSEKWTMARIFVLHDNQSSRNQLLPIREVEQTRDSNSMSVNCIRWLPVSGQGLVYATNTGQLRILT